MLQLFNKPIFDEEIVKEEVHTYHPHTKSFNYNDEIEITINQKDTLMAMYDAYIYIEGRANIQNTLQTNEITAAAEPKKLHELLVNNFGSFMFESISYELNGKEIEKVRSPGIVSTIKAYLCLSEDECNSYQISGWNWPNGVPCTTEENTFALLIPLKFYFGLFSDYRKVIGGKHTIKLVRARSDNNCFKSTKEKVELNLTRVELKVKHIIPNDEIRLQLYDQFKVNRPIFITNRKWEIHELPVLNKSNKEVWAVKTSTNLERPRYIIVAFQTNAYGNPANDSTMFDHLNLTSIRAYLNSEAYPYEPIRCNFTENQFIEPYQHYCDFQKSFYGKASSTPLMNYLHFKNRCLFVIDCTKQNDSIKQTTIDLKLEFESSTEFPNNTRGYCIIIHDSLIEYKPLSETIRNVI